MARTLRLDLVHPICSDQDIKLIKEVLDTGGIIGLPTDTFYGLGANPLNEEAVKTIYRIKKRPTNKPFTILVDSVKTLNNFVSGITTDMEKLMGAFWPGPLTILFSVMPLMPPKLSAYSGKIGARIPDHVVTRYLLEKIGHPLTGTSANISESENITTAAGVEKALGPQLNLIIDAGECPGGKESTVIDPTVSPPVIIRDGAISREEIESELGTKCA